MNQPRRVACGLHRCASEENPVTKQPRVAIVILNWMRPDHTVECLASLAKLDYPADRLDVIIVDNAAHEGNAPTLRQSFPHVTLIENARNLGFAGGSNVGIRAAMARGADYVLLLNDDTEVAPDFLRSLVAPAESDPSIGILGPKIYYFDEPRIIWFAGGDVGRYGEVSHRGVDQVDEIDDGSPLAVEDVGYVTGCAMLVRRAVVEAVGALDERFFAYYEETEWCARARRAGFRVVYVSGGRVWHKVTRTQRETSRLYLYLMARNRLLYLQAGHASGSVVARACLSLLRTAVSWQVRPKHRAMRPFTGALLAGVGDFLLGHFGAPPDRIAFKLRR